jgi:hypothetical protein
VHATAWDIMAVHKGTNKVHNKKLRRRREGLSTKSYEYGELDGVELALFIRYPKRGEFYSSSWLHRETLQVHVVEVSRKMMTESTKDVY